MLSKKVAHTAMQRSSCKGPNTGKVCLLHVCSNNLTDLPEDFSELRQICRLRIKYNQLSRLPAAVVRLSQLVTLELSGNQISRLDSSIAKVNDRATD